MPQARAVARQLPWLKSFTEAEHSLIAEPRETKSVAAELGGLRPVALVLTYGSTNTSGA